MRHNRAERPFTPSRPLKRDPVLSVTPHTSPKLGGQPFYEARKFRSRLVEPKMHVPEVPMPLATADRPKTLKPA